jgi:hypothetical protein
MNKTFDETAAMNAAAATATESSLDNDTAIPPTEPVSVMPPTDLLPAKKSKSSQPRSRRAPRQPRGKNAKPLVVPGAKLIPDLNDHSEALSEEVFFWVGMIMEAPVENLTIAGIRMSKTQERVVRSKSDPKKHDRFPVYGGICRMTRQRFNTFCETMSRTIFRFHSSEAIKEELGTGVNMGDVHVQHRRGYPIQIPSAELIASRKANGKSVRPYRASAMDEAAAYYCYAIECHNQAKPKRGEDSPDTLDITGIVWPGTK